MNKRRRLNSKGFTVIELMIATMVFGVVLLFVTVAILQFTRVYYKGVTQANTQDTTRTLVDNITQAIQFNGGTITATPPPVYGATAAFCVGNVQYTYLIGKQMVDSTPTSSQTWHSVVSRDLGGCVAGSPTPPMNSQFTVSGARELLSPKMRLSKLAVTPIGSNVYRVTVKVVFGDDDLLLNPTSADTKCRGQSGSQFCAVSEITTVVTKRVE